MAIRPYDHADLPGLLDVWYRASQIAHPFLSERFFRQERAQIADRWLPMAETLVDERDGRVAGFLSLIGNEVGAIFVDPTMHGLGIGRGLMDRASSLRPHLELGVFEANEVGRRFYDLYGFRETDRGIHVQTGQAELRLRLDP